MIKKSLIKFWAILASTLGLGLFCESANASNVSIIYKVGKTGTAAGDLVSAADHSELEAMVASVKNGEASKICIRSYSSPEGSYSWNQRLAERRSKSTLDLLREIWPELPDSLVAIDNVAEDWAPAIAYVRRSSQPWKDEALQILKSNIPDKEEKLQDLWGGVVWDELLWNCFTRVRRTVVSTVPKANIQFSESSGKPEISVKFAVGSTQVDKFCLDNPVQLEALTAAINSNAPPEVIYLDAFASPEGRVSWNKVLASRRAESVKSLLVELGVPSDRITVRTREENWEGLRSVVESGYSGVDKAEVLDILADSSLDPETREEKLQSLSGGATWSRLVSGWMENLRCVKISL